MKKKVRAAVYVLIVSTLGITTFISCDKDTYSHLEVTVKDQATGKGIGGARVAINNGSTVADTGYTDADGMYKTKFAAPAVFNIAAQLVVIDTPFHPLDMYSCTRNGVSSIRLKEGETVSATVILSDSVSHRLIQ